MYAHKINDRIDVFPLPDAPISNTYHCYELLTMFSAIDVQTHLLLHIGMMYNLGRPVRR